jgi:hypothetical protein
MTLSTAYDKAKGDEEHILHLPGDRQLAYAHNGPSTSRTIVIFFAGLMSVGSALDIPAPCRELGTHWIAPTLPGMGNSSIRDLTEPYHVALSRDMPICSDEPVDEVQSHDDDEKEGRLFSQRGSTVQTDLALPAGMIALPWNTVSGTTGNFAYYIEVENPNYTITREITQRISYHSGRRANLGPSNHAALTPSETGADSSYVSATDSICSQRGRAAEPDLRSGTVSRLANLYLENVNSIHPILSPSQLGSLVDSLMKLRDVGNTTKPSSIKKCKDGTF